MADKPIIFSGPMVCALLDGRKTQTRRVLNPQPKVLNNGIWYRPYPVLRPLQWQYLHGDRIAGFTDARYAPGDRLYVREHWRIETTAFDCFPPREIPPGQPILYEADAQWGLNKTTGRFRQAMHMPRWASRLTLTVTDVRVQRLQEISGEDCLAEGVQCATCDAMKASACHGRGCFASIDAYRTLWNSLHGPGAWEANPWVAAYSFTVQRGNIDAIKETSND